MSIEPCRQRGISTVTLSSLQFLPFPGITERVIEAHLANMDFYENVKTSITDLTECQKIKEKFIFSWLHRIIYNQAAFVAKTLTRSKWLVDKIPFLFGCASQEIPRPTITVPMHQPESLKLRD